MSFSRVKLECSHIIDKKTKSILYSFRLQKNKTVTRLYTKDKNVYQSFKKELSKNCILNTFQEDFHIQKLIGAGTFGKVYLVERKSDGSCFAAKMFFKDSILKQKKGKESLLNEINILRKLDHPGIMKLYEVHESLLSIFLIMELLEGGELLDRLERQSFYSENDCALILRRIIEPLNYMHQKGIIHRDIKPDNLILRSQEDAYDVVIADLGLAHDLNTDAIHFRCGTPGYCGPEVLRSKGEKFQNEPKCDVFSVGCIFYYLLFGEAPFQGRTYKETYDRNKQCLLNIDEKKLRNLSSDAYELLNKMLACKSDNRFTLEECLHHTFLDQKHRDLAATFHVSRRYIPYNQSQRNKEKDEPSDIGEKSRPNSQEDASFIMGMPNMIKGRINTVSEILFSDNPRKMTEAEPTIIPSSNRPKARASLLVPGTSSNNKNDPMLFKIHNEINQELNASFEGFEDRDHDDVNARVDMNEMSKKLKNISYDGVVRNPFSFNA